MTKEQLFKEIDSEIETLENREKVLIQRMNESFILFFDFSNPEELFKLQFKKEVLKSLKNVLENPAGGHTIKSLLTYYIKDIEEDLLDRKLTNSSTSVFNNLKISFQNDVKQNLRKFYLYLLNLFKEEQ